MHTNIRILCFGRFGFGIEFVSLPQAHRIFVPALQTGGWRKYDIYIPNFWKFSVLCLQD